MPNDEGLYTLAEMRERTRRNIDALRSSITQVPVVGTPPLVPGDEIPGTQDIDPMYSNEDLNYFINTALTERAVSIFVEDPNSLADSETVDILANIAEYSLPADMGQIRSLWWKDPSTPYTIQPPTKRTFMIPSDEEHGVIRTLANGVPTYRRQLNQFVLSTAPKKDNPQGVEVRYTKWLNYLGQDDSVIETQFARILQECVILDAAIACASRRSFMDPSALAADLAKAEGALTLALRNSNNPPFMQLSTRHPVRQW